MHQRRDDTARHIDGTVRRLDLVSALGGAGGLTAAHAIAALRAELGELEATAGRGGSEAVAELARSIRQVIEQLTDACGAAPDSGHDVLILDPDEVTRDFIALAVEAQGHRVRVASTIDELLVMFRERPPHVLLTEARIDGHRPDGLCDLLRRTISADSIPIVLFASATGAELELLASRAGADLYLSKDQGIDQLVRDLNGLFDEILW